MALKWAGRLGYQYSESGDWYIKKANGGGGYMLNFGWNLICMLKTVAGCKRVANCINREMEKDHD